MAVDAVGNQKRPYATLEEVDRFWVFGMILLRRILLWSVSKGNFSGQSRVSQDRDGTKREQQPPSGDLWEPTSIELLAKRSTHGWDSSATERWATGC
jgi:hypothetical protein